MKKLLFMMMIASSLNAADGMLVHSETQTSISLSQTTMSAPELAHSWTQTPTSLTTMSAPAIMGRYSSDVPTTRSANDESLSSMSSISGNGEGYLSLMLQLGCNDMDRLRLELPISGNGEGYLSLMLQLGCNDMGRLRLELPIRGNSGGSLPTIRHSVNGGNIPTSSTSGNDVGSLSLSPTLQPSVSGGNTPTPVPSGSDVGGLSLSPTLQPSGNSGNVPTSSTSGSDGNSPTSTQSTELLPSNDSGNTSVPIANVNIESAQSSSQVTEAVGHDVANDIHNHSSRGMVENVISLFSSVFGTLNDAPEAQRDLFRYRAFDMADMVMRLVEGNAHNIHGGE
ncbi:hypothetical protein FACS1894122_12660 [Alphaproteobacteria bacterium]|nr:hypothetical protein FACS1894122_12660 [Alphaproteobacteria bacterium]